MVVYDFTWDGTLKMDNRVKEFNKRVWELIASDSGPFNLDNEVLDKIWEEVNAEHNKIGEENE